MVLAANRLVVAVVTPEAVVPLSVRPVDPLPAAPVVRTSHSEPLAEGTGPAFQPKVALVPVMLLTVRPPGVMQDGTVTSKV